MSKCSKIAQKGDIMPGVDKGRQRSSPVEERKCMAGKQRHTGERRAETCRVTGPKV